MYLIKRKLFVVASPSTNTFQFSTLIPQSVSQISKHTVILLWQEKTKHRARERVRQVDRQRQWQREMVGVFMSMLNHLEIRAESHFTIFQKQMAYPIT